MTIHNTAATAAAITPAIRAQQVIAVTAHAWDVPKESAHAFARRARHGYVPQRVLRRLGSSTGLLGRTWPLSYSF